MLSDPPSKVPSMEPSRNPTPQPSKLVTYQPCEICPDGKVVTKLDETITDPASGLVFLCAMMQQKGRSGFMSPDDCETVRKDAVGPCDCRLPQPTQSPVEAPETESGPLVQGNGTGPSTSSSPKSHMMVYGQVMLAFNLLRLMI